MSPSFRKVRDDELDAAYAIYLEVFDWLNAKGVRQWLRPVPRELFMQRQGDGQLFALYLHGRIAAVVTVAFEVNSYWPEAAGAAPQWWIKTLAVARQWSGKGVGPRVLSECEAFIRAAGASEVFLDCVDVGFLPAFYAKLGYEGLRQKEITYPSGNSFPMVLMRKRIPLEALEPMRSTRDSP